MLTHRRGGWGVRALLALLLLASAPPAFAQPPPARWVEVGVHPQAARQPTAIGRTLAALEAWHGQLYAGYGDYGDNTGPIGISPFDPATAAFTQVHVSDTEAIQNWRAIGDQLWAPATDRRKDADFAVGEPWRDARPIGTTHAYDIVTIDGDDLWLAGSSGVRAALWRSLDGGATWALAQAEGPASGIQNDFARYYFAGVLGGRLYVQADDFYGAPHARSRIFDGSAWADGPNLLWGSMGWRPLAFGGEMVYQGSAQGGPLLRFDGSAPVRRAVGWNASAVTVAGDMLYVLRQRFPAGADGLDRAVVRTADLESWEVLEAPAPDGARSLAVLDGSLYAGATEARLFGLQGDAAWRPEPVAWNAKPVIHALRPVSGTAFARGDAIPLEAEATDADGTVARGQFWFGALKLAELGAPPFAVRWTDAPTGTHRIMFRAVDDAGDYVEAWTTVVVEARENPTEPTPEPTATTSVPTELPTQASAAWRIHLPWVQRGAIAR